MKIKKFVATLSLAAMTTFSLAACGDDSDSDGTKDNPLVSDNGGDDKDDTDKDDTDNGNDDADDADDDNDGIDVPGGDADDADDDNDGMDAPGGDADDADDDNDGMDAPGGDADGMDGGEATEQAYIDGMKMILSGAAPNLDEATLDELAQCVSDLTFDQISPESRESVANGVDVTTGQDGQILYDAASSCASEYMN